MANNRKHLIEYTDASDLTGGTNGARFVTTTSGDSKTQNVPLIYDSNGNVISTATRTGTTTNFATATAGGKTTSYLAMWDSNDNLSEVDPATVGGGGAAPTNYPDNVPFVDSGFSNLNWSGSTAKSTSGDIFRLAETTNAGNDLRGYITSVPSTPYKLWTRFLFRARQNNAAEQAGIFWYDSGSGKALIFGMRGDGRLLSYGWSAITGSPTFTMYYDGAMPQYAVNSGAFSFGLEDDGTNKDAVLSPTLEYSRIFIRWTHSEYLTPTDYGMFLVDGVARGESYIEFLSWDNY